jgi:hypothetical protein
MIKIAMIKTVAIVFTCIATFVGGFWIKYNQPTEDWKMIMTQDGVEFYALNKESNVSETINTVIKIVNTNDYEVNVSFSPSFTCGAEAPKQQPKTSSSIAGNGANTMHNFKSCKKGEDTQIVLKGIEIVKK